jgi:hypothetical protein
MSFAPFPGMQVYPVTPDAPSGVSDLPQGGQLLNSQAGGLSVAYSAHVDVTTALVIFALCYFGAVGGLHYLSNAAGKIA